MEFKLLSRNLMCIYIGVDWVFVDWRGECLVPGASRSAGPAAPVPKRPWDQTLAIPTANNSHYFTHAEARLRGSMGTAS